MTDRLRTKGSYQAKVGALCKAKPYSKSIRYPTDSIAGCTHNHNVAKFETKEVTMLQLNRKADYGLRLMLEVGGSAQGTLTTAEVARRQQIPYEFLRKVAQPLVSRGLLASERGVHGGLSLARPAKEISVLDIVSTFGAASLNRCTIDPPLCDRRPQCAVYPVWAEAQHQVEQVLAGSRLSQLITHQETLARSDREAQSGRQPIPQDEPGPGQPS